MKFFADTVTKPYIAARGYRRVCEIGASYGDNTDKLLEVPSLDITIVDPCVDLDLAEKYRSVERLRVVKGTSLEKLPDLTGQFDCILIDGDHNWYTVYHELKAIEENDLLADEGTIFFHDVAWPYGLRDMYYEPSRIPKEFLHPHAQRGLMRGRSELGGEGEVHPDLHNAHLHNALHEGGPRNGVLSAILDFVREGGGKYAFFFFEEQHGLGVLLKSRRPWLNPTFVRYFLKARSTALLRRVKRAVKRVLLRS